MSLNLAKKFDSLGVKTKLAALFVVFGLIPAAAMFGIFMYEQSNYRNDRIQPLLSYANEMGDVIDRSLYDRYSDVQSFALNAAAHKEQYWRDETLSEKNALIHSMNGYMRNYDVYQFMMMVDLQGNPVAFNTLDHYGSPIVGVERVYDMNFSDAPWFKDTMAEKYLEGKNGLTGTVVEEPYQSQKIQKLLKSDGFVMTFSAPVYNPQGERVAVWVNYVDFYMIDDIVNAFYKEMVKQGLTSAELTVLDHYGRVIVDYDPSNGKDINTPRDFDIIGKFNLASKLEVAQKAIDGKSGVEDAFHARKKLWQVAAYTKSHGIHDFPGMGWGFLVRVGEEQLLATLHQVVWEMVVALIVCIAFVLFAGLWIGGRASKPIFALRDWAHEIAHGRNAVIQDQRDDEIGQLMQGLSPVGDKAMIWGSTLQNLRNNVIIADNDDEITFANEGTIKSLTDLQEDIRQQFPNFEVEKVIGGSIHRFHKNPDRIRQIIQALQPGQIHSAKISVGPLTLDLNAGGVFASDGERLGTYVEWRDITQEVATRRQSDIMNSTMAGMASNVIIADNDDNIQYANEASMKNLTRLTDDIRQQFPNFDAGKLMGANIHQFHKNPDRIKQVLRALQPGEQHKAHIQIGPVTLSLNAGGVFDSEGNRMGSYVEWADVTEDVARQKREEEQARVKAQLERDVNNVANMINDATRDIAQGNVNLSERTEAQAASIEQTTATMQQITERVNEGAESAKQALGLSTSARDAADRGGKVVKDAINAMAEISESSNKISDIIGVIDEIAFQTNLLALNAAVEAARAGEQGRGFAVVASEVRSLAGRSATAAKEIKDLINESVDKVKTGTNQVNETGDCLSDIIMNVQQVAEMVSQISEGSQEQALSITEINKSVNQMDSFTQQNAALVEEAASASKSLEEQSSNLVAIINGDQVAAAPAMMAETTEPSMSPAPEANGASVQEENGCPEMTEQAPEGDALSDDQAWMDA